MERNVFTCRLVKYGGIGAISAVQIVSAVTDISRFHNDDHLVSYSGLGHREHETGIGTPERDTLMFKHGLKNTFFAAARKHTLYNSESEPAGNNSAKRLHTSPCKKKYTGPIPEIKAETGCCLFSQEGGGHCRLSLI